MKKMLPVLIFIDRENAQLAVWYDRWPIFFLPISSNREGLNIVVGSSKTAKRVGHL